MLIVTLKDGRKGFIIVMRPDTRQLRVEFPQSTIRETINYSQVLKMHWSRRDVQPSKAAGVVLQTFNRYWQPSPKRYRTQVTAVLRNGTKHDIYANTAQATHAYIVGMPGKYVDWPDVDRLIVKEVLC